MSCYSFQLLTMTDPSDEELSVAVNDIREQDPDIGVKKILRLLHERTPEWTPHVNVGHYIFPHTVGIINTRQSKRVRDVPKRQPPTPIASSPVTSKRASQLPVPITPIRVSQSPTKRAVPTPARRHESDADDDGIDIMARVAELQKKGIPTAVAISMLVNGDIDLKPSAPTRSSGSVMEALMKLLGHLCAGGDTKASRRATQIDMTLKLSGAPPLPPLADFLQDYGHGIYPMKSCKLATTLITQLTAPDHALTACTSWNSRALGGLPTADRVTKIPSADLPSEYIRLYAKAVGVGETAILAVNLVDVEMILRGEGVKRGGIGFSTFSHSFVLVIAPEGVRIIQAYGEWGYSLGENLKSRASRLLTFKEAEDYVHEYDRLCEMKVCFCFFALCYWAKHSLRVLGIAK